MAKIMLIAGHGYSDPGAVGNGTNERDFIRENIVDVVGHYLKESGHTVKIYNKSQDCFQDTAYGQQIGNYKDYGLYWVKNQGIDIVVEFHLDAAGASASGGHVIIPSGLGVDNIDKGIQSAINKHVGVIRGISPRDNLLNCNVAKEIGLNYRLVELGFITSKKDMDYIKKNARSYCMDIAAAIGGKAKQKAPVKAKAKVITVIPNSYKSKKNETVSGIAKKFGLTTTQLRSFNPDLPKVIKEGTFMYLKKQVEKPKPIATKKNPTQYKRYKVKKGDTLKYIADAYKVSVDSLVKLNGIKKNAIFIDQIIRIMPLDDWNKRQAVKKKAPVTKLNPIQYLQKKGLTVSSDPNTYQSGVWGYRNFIANGINYDAFCGGYHRAYDLYGVAGCAIPAVFDGEVVAGTDSYGNFGGTVVVANEKLGLQVVYGHLRRPIKLKVGQKVKQGDIVGYQGATNYYNNPMSEHLHIQFQKYGYFANEIDFVCSGIDIKNIDVTKYPAVNLYK